MVDKKFESQQKKTFEKINAIQKEIGKDKTLKILDALQNRNFMILLVAYEKMFRKLGMKEKDFNEAIIESQKEFEERFEKGMKIMDKMELNENAD